MGRRSVVMFCVTQRQEDEMPASVTPDGARVVRSDGALAGRVGLITGGGRGLGTEIASALLDAGAAVAVLGRDTGTLAATCAALDPTGERMLPVTADVRDADGVVRAVDRVRSELGRVDVLVNNSGIAGPTAPLWECEPQEWRAAVETNLVGAAQCTRAVLPDMIDRRSGSVVFIGSMTGKRPLWGRTSYAASKTGLIGLVRTLAAETGPFGIRVNLVSPGPIEGERIDRVLRAQAATRGITTIEARSEMLDDSPLGRLVRPADVAAVVAFLAGDGAAAITGEDVNVSAGIVMY
ncbi:SDR family NAD(P)-dependent oxidoreductase [Pseudonocardia sichuanensis]